MERNGTSTSGLERRPHRYAHVRFWSAVVITRPLCLITFDLSRVYVVIMGACVDVNTCFVAKYSLCKHVSQLWGGQARCCVHYAGSYRLKSFQITNCVYVVTCWMF